MVVAHRPARRQRHPSRQGGVALNHLLWIRPVNKIIIQIATFHPKGQQILTLAPDVKKAAPGVVEKNAVRDSMANPHVEWHRYINRIRTGIVRVSVQVPHDIVITAQLPAAFVQPAILFTKPINVFVVAEPLGDSDFTARKRNAAPRVIGVQTLTGGIGERESQRIVLQENLESGCF